MTASAVPIRQAVNARANVLVVDDQPRICELVTTILRSEGAQVHSATCGREAVNILHKENIEVLFTDLQLPDCDGIALIRKSLCLHPQLTTIVITGFGTMDSAVEAIRVGACDYVTKPIHRDGIISALNRALAFKNGKAAGDPCHRADDVRHRSQVVAASLEMRQIVADARRIAATNYPALIIGETGVGKKLIGRLIHESSSACSGDFVHIPCVSMLNTSPGTEPPDWRRVVLSSEGALGDPEGKTADHHAVYLEDIGKLPDWAQLQLLHVIESGLTRVGAQRQLRLIASTTRPLETECSAGRFQRGLHEVLSLVPMTIPPLRDRREDLQALVFHFLDELCREEGLDAGKFRRQISDDVWQSLYAHRWPGNVRELFRMITQAVFRTDGENFAGFLRQHCQAPPSPADCETISVPLVNDLKSIEQYVIREVVRRQGGNKAAAARQLGLHRRTLYRLLEERNPRPLSDSDSSRTASCH